MNLTELQKRWSWLYFYRKFVTIIIIKLLNKFCCAHQVTWIYINIFYATVPLFCLACVPAFRQDLGELFGPKERGGGGRGGEGSMGERATLLRMKP